MKKIILFLLSVYILLYLSTYGKQTETRTNTTAEESFTEAETTQTDNCEWPRAGDYIDEDGNTLSITYVDNNDSPALTGWRTRFLIGKDLGDNYYRGALQIEKNSLYGIVISDNEKKPELFVTIYVEGKDGVQLAVDGGKTYHFRPEWSREGHYIDENGNRLNIKYRNNDDTTDQLGWYALFMNGPDLDSNVFDSTLQPERNTLHGDLTSEGQRLTVTIYEEGENGVQLAVEGGETYHFRPEWSRTGHYIDENGFRLYITYQEGYYDQELNGWYALFINGPDPDSNYFDSTLEPERYTLHGDLTSEGEKLTVIISEEGEEGVKFAVEGGETYHFRPDERYSIDATLSVSVYGLGSFTYVKDYLLKSPGKPMGSLRFKLEEPTAYMITAIADDDWYFDKWLMNGEEYSTEEKIYVDIEQDTNLIAVFQCAEWDYSINHAMEVIGEYASGNAKALVECEGENDVKITIERGDSSTGLEKWIMSNWFYAYKPKVNYDNCVKTIVTYDEDGKTASETTEYENGTGSIVFDLANTTFTWKDDQENEEEMVFEWSYYPVEIDIGSSDIYSEEERNSIMEMVRTEIPANFDEPVLYSIRYAGDKSVTEENLCFVNDWNPEGKYTQVAQVLADFRYRYNVGSEEKVVDVFSGWLWVARTDGGDWEAVFWED